jgi:hypothetical protein
MALVTRQGKGSRLTIQEMDGNLLYLEGGALSRNPIIRSFQICGYDMDSWELKINSGNPFMFESSEVDRPDDRFYGISSVESWVSYFNTPENLGNQFDQRYGGIINAEIFLSTAKVKTLPTNYTVSVETFIKTSNNPDYRVSHTHSQGSTSMSVRNIEEIKNKNIQQDPDFYNTIFGVSGTESTDSIIGSTFYNNRSFRKVNKFEDLDRILDRGIIEKGKISGESQLDILWGEFAKNRSPYLSGPYQNPGEFFDRLITIGIFVVDFDSGAKPGIFDEVDLEAQKPKGVGVFSGKSLRENVLPSLAAIPA